MWIVTLDFLKSYNLFFKSLIHKIVTQYTENVSSKQWMQLHAQYTYCKICLEPSQIVNVSYMHDALEAQMKNMWGKKEQYWSLFGNNLDTTETLQIQVFVMQLPRTIFFKITVIAIACLHEEHS